MSVPAASPTPSWMAAHLERRDLVAALFLVLTLLMTWPLVLRLTSFVPAGAGDLWQNYWNFWWWKKALLELHQSPYYTQFLFYPSGSNAIFHTHSPFNMLVALPLTAALGEAAAYNACILLALWLSGFGAYLLTKDLIGDSRGAFLAGIVFAFFPQHMEQIFEHLNLISTQFIALTLFFFLRVCRQGGWRNVAGTGICFALNALCSWHLGLMLILALAPFSAILLIRRQRPARAMLRDLAVAALIATLILLPVVLPLLIEMVESSEPYYQKRTENRGIDAAFLFVPHYDHPLFGRFTADAYVGRAYTPPGFVCYLGFVPTALALLAVVRRRKGAALWMAFAFGTLIISLGKHPFWNGELITAITLPFGLLENVPVFQLLRLAHRFLILTSLGLAVLAGLGWTALRKPTDRRFLMLAALICIEYAWLPFPTRPVEISPIYDELAKAGRQAIIDVPSLQRSRAARNMVAQTVHNRPIADGYLSTLPPETQQAIDRDPMLSDLLGVPPKRSGPLDREHLLQLGFDTFILHKYRRESYGRKHRAEVEPWEITKQRAVRRLGGVPDHIMDGLRQELTALCGAPAFEDDKIVVFYLDRVADEDEPDRARSSGQQIPAS